MIYRQWLNTIEGPHMRPYRRRSKCGSVKFYCSSSGIREGRDNTFSTSAGREFSKTKSLGDRSREIMSAL